MPRIAAEVPLYYFPWVSEEAAAVPGVLKCRNGGALVPKNAGWLVEKLSPGSRPVAKFRDEPPKRWDDIAAMLTFNGQIKPDALDIMLPFQQHGEAWAINQHAALLHWPGGAGKTLGLLTIAATVSETAPILFVTRASARGQIARDGFWRFTSIEPFVFKPEVKSKAKNPRKKPAETWPEYLERKRAAGERIAAIVAWTDLRPRVKQLAEFPAGFILLLDELHLGKQFKRGKSIVDEDGGRTWVAADNMAHAAEMLSRRARWRYGATATPLKDRTRDLWAQCDLLEPGAWGTAWSFFQRYCDARPIPGVPGAWSNDGVSNIEELKDRLSFLMDTVPYAVSHAALVGLKRRESWYIDAQEGTGWSSKRYAEELKKANGVPGRVMEVRVSSASATLRPQLVQRIVDEIEGQPNAKIMIFDIRQEAVELLAADVRNALPTVQLWAVHGGSTTPETREVIRRQYMAHPGPCVFVATGDSCGTSMSFHDTDFLFMAAPPWTPGDVHQWEQRVSRLGQTRAVRVVYCVLRGSVVEAIASKVINKMPAVEKVVQDAETAGAVDALGGTDDTDRIAANLLSVFASMDEDAIDD